MHLKSVCRIRFSSRSFWVSSRRKTSISCARASLFSCDLTNLSCVEWSTDSSREVVDVLFEFQLSKVWSVKYDRADASDPLPLSLSSSAERRVKLLVSCSLRRKFQIRSLGLKVNLERVTGWWWWPLLLTVWSEIRTFIRKCTTRLQTLVLRFWLLFFLRK